jgi:tetratricopeptide (TPR) repeat protein
MAEGDYWLKRVLSQSGATMLTAARAKALSAACCIAEMAGDYRGAQVLGAEALALARALRDPARIAWALCQLGNLRRVLPDQRIHGMAQLEESLILFKEIDDHFGIARALWTLGNATFRQGNTARSIVLQEESLARFRAIGDRSGASDPLRSLGEIALEQGNFEHAVTLCEESLVLCREVGDRCGVVEALYVLGRAKFELGNLETASALLAESLTMARDYSTKAQFGWVHNDIGTLARFGGRYAEAAACYAESLTLFSTGFGFWGLARTSPQFFCRKVNRR